MEKTLSLLERFKPALAAGQPDEAFLIGKENGYSVYYVPFEYVNPAAKLVLVGITPGPKQMACAYSTARRLLATPVDGNELSRRTKQTCAFVGMRNKIDEMLDHFGLAKCIGAPSATSLWNTHFALFHVTSVVPNAAFINGAYFNGPFSAVLDSKLLRSEFEQGFVESVKSINGEAVYVGMGPVVDEALMWCASRGVLRHEQVLGYLPHASGASGSQFAYFLQRKRLSDLKPKDPVRHRAENLDAAYKRMEANVKNWCIAKNAA